VIGRPQAGHPKDMNHPGMQWVCGECTSHGPVRTFHVHKATSVQQFAQVPAVCPVCSADAVAVVPASAPVSRDV
jgi:hypothetical protein